MKTQQKIELTPCPYPAFSRPRRKWVDGWNWYVTNRRRAVDDPDFFRGWRDARDFFDLNGFIETRKDYQESVSV